uniref:Uncharacterized protein n=1 Tax=Arundo donax TaxID=35708 RepID=A0A0A9DFP2_ARUDO
MHLAHFTGLVLVVYMMLVSMWLTRFEYDAAAVAGRPPAVGVDGCCLTTAAVIGLLLRRSRSLTSSCANRSSFSALVCSATFFPRNSTDSTFFCDSISSATHPPFAAPRLARGVPVACAGVTKRRLVVRRVQSKPRETSQLSHYTTCVV